MVLPWSFELPSCGPRCGRRTQRSMREYKFTSRSSVPVSFSVAARHVHHVTADWPESTWVHSHARRPHAELWPVRTLPSRPLMRFPGQTVMPKRARWQEAAAVSCGLSHETVQGAEAEVTTGFSAVASAFRDDPGPSPRPNEGVFKLLSNVY